MVQIVTSLIDIEFVSTAVSLLHLRVYCICVKRGTDGWLPRARGAAAPRHKFRTRCRPAALSLVYLAID